MTSDIKRVLERRSQGRPLLDASILRNWWFIVLVILVILIMIVGAHYKNIPAGNCMVSTKGSSAGEVKGSGWHFVKPFGGWKLVETRTQTINFVEKDEAGDTKGSISLLTSDNLQVTIDMTLTFHLSEKTVGDLIVDSGEDYKTRIILPKCRGEPREEATNYTALELIGDRRAEFADGVESRIMAALAEKYVYVESVDIRGIRLPTAMMNAVEEKKVAEQNIETAKHELEAEKYIADKKVVDAMAEYNVSIIQAEATANVTIIEASANAEAMQVLMESLGEDSGNLSDTEALLAYEWLVMLRDPDSKVQVVFTDGSTPVIYSPQPVATEE